MSQEPLRIFPGVEYKEANLALCEVCDNYHGTVLEKYNGNVPVLCRCDLKQILEHEGHFPSPSLVSSDGKTLWWTPTTDHKASDGKWWHTPHFFSIPLNLKKPATGCSRDI